jgi:nucleoside-diphosphate-sugar epimerase
MTLASQPVLVTGASGFLGGALALRLAADGVRVRALVRQPAKCEFLRAQPQIEVVTGDLADADSLRAAAAGCGLVYHSAAALAGSLGHQRSANVDGTRRLLHAAADAGVGRFIHVSTLGVYGVNYPGVITEDMRHGPGSDPYGLTKSEAETVVREVGAARGLAYSIIRPGMIYGPRARLLTEGIFRLARLKPTPWFGDGGGLSPCIFVEDVISLMRVLAEHPAAVGEAFNCCSDPSPTWRTFIGAHIRLARGVNDDFLELPRWLLYSIAGIGMLISPPYSAGRVLPDYARFTQRRAQFSIAKARHLLGWVPQISLEEGIARCAPWLQEQDLLMRRPHSAE